MGLGVLRLAAMPQEEFSAWSVSALLAGAPLAVSRAFRTETHANAYLAMECGRRHAVITSAGLQGRSEKRVVAERYRQILVDTFRVCERRARDKLSKLLKWAQRQPSWVFDYIEDAHWQLEQSVLRRGEGHASAPRTAVLPVEPPPYISPSNVDQRLAHAAIVALVNSRAQEFSPFFVELLKPADVKLSGFTQVLERLKKLKRVATAIVQLKGPGCGGVDLSAFHWVNGLRGSPEVYATLRYLLPELEALVSEFLEDASGTLSRR